MKHWHWKLLRGIQCVLIVTRGMISPRREFFEAAFGESFDEFKRIVLMPERYIIYRKAHENNGVLDWTKQYNGLGKNQKREFMEIAGNRRVKPEDVTRQTSLRLKNILSHYIES